ncbi:MAG: sulfotransferase family 2 domain-containing protein [Planctomycetaceae bacterium]
MIISHRHKFIFIKTNKTAGTSVEIALSKYCGPDDIITPISKKDEPKRQAAGGLGPQNYLAPVSSYRVADIGRLFQGRRKKRFYNHISATEVVDAIGLDVWNSYFKFCFERNPWDRTVSAYYWKHSKEPRPTMTEFIDSGYPSKLKKRGFDLYSLDGKIAVDAVYRFEHLADDLDDARQRIGLPTTMELINAKSNQRKEKRDYREYFSANDAERIATLFADEIEHLGYAF